MSVLAKNTYLGKLELVEVFEYYDKPVLFACRSASGQLYLVVQENDYDDYETWIYCSLSNTRFLQIRSGGIDLYNAFKLAEDDFIFLVKLFYNTNIDSEITPIPTSQLNESQLPKPNVFINLATQTLAVTELSVEQRAKQLAREYIELALEFPSQRRNEAPISALSRIMQQLQKTVISLAHTMSNLYKDSEKPSRDLIANMDILLLNVSAGSFKLEMASLEQASLFGDTFMGDVLDELAQLVEIGNNKQNLELIFRKYKPSVPKDYLKLLQAISSSKVDKVDMRWASPNGKRVGKVIFSSPIIFSTIETIKTMVFRETNIITVEGLLTGAFTAREFEIKTPDKTYRGILDNTELTVEASEVINSATLQNRYIVTLREKITHYVATNETQTTYALIDVKYPNL